MIKAISLPKSSFNFLQLVDSPCRKSLPALDLLQHVISFAKSSEDMDMIGHDHERINFI